MDGRGSRHLLPTYLYHSNFAQVSSTTTPLTTLYRARPRFYTMETYGFMAVTCAMLGSRTGLVASEETVLYKVHINLRGAH